MVKGGTLNQNIEKLEWNTIILRKLIPHLTIGPLVSQHENAVMPVLATIPDEHILSSAWKHQSIPPFQLACTFCKSRFPVCTMDRLRHKTLSFLAPTVLPKDDVLHFCVRIDSHKISKLIRICQFFPFGSEQQKIQTCDWPTWNSKADQSQQRCIEDEETRIHRRQ
jgi:hypothetical protein